MVTNPRTFNQTIRITVAGGGLPEVVLDVEPGAEGAEFPFDATDGTVATVTMADTTLATIVWEQPEDCDDHGTGGEGPGTEKTGSELPKTGTQTLLLVGAALGLLTLGGAMYVVARRRTGSTA